MVNVYITMEKHHFFMGKYPVNGHFRDIPSGKLCYWKWPFIVDLPFKEMVIFNSCVSLPEGIYGYP